MRKKIITLILSLAMAVSVITGCGNTAAETSTETTETVGQSTDTSAETSADTAKDASADASASAEQATATSATPASYEELIAALHPGQGYAYAPILEGDKALLVSSYVFDDLEGHQATCEATIFIEKDGGLKKVTTVQGGGTAYPIAVSDDNSLMLSMRNSVVKGHVSKETGEFVITEEAHVNYSEAEDGHYHNYKEGVAEVPADSSLYDELSEKYLASDILSFEKSGVTADGTPHLAGGVYAAYVGDNQYEVSSYYVFYDETSGATETPDGLSGLPFTYENNGDSIVFHFESADDNSEAKFAWGNEAFPTLTFEKETLYLSCLGNADAATFDAVRYYDNDNNLYMKVMSFDETSLTGDLYREEMIKAELVDNAEMGSYIYSTIGTQYQVVSFEEVNKEFGYGTDEEFKKDVVGTTRFTDFLVKDSDGNAYALEKGEYDQEYHVVYPLNDGNIQTLVEKNVTFKIKENCEITLQKFVKNGEFMDLTPEYLIGREFKGDNYPGWSADATEYYMTKEMLVAVSVVDGELYNFVQRYVP